MALNNLFTRGKKEKNFFPTYIKQAETAHVAAKYVFNGWVPVEVDGSGMLPVITFGTESQIVSGSKRPFSVVVDETEVFCMVVFVVSQHIEGH